MRLYATRVIFQLKNTWQRIRQTFFWIMQWLPRSNSQREKLTAQQKLKGYHELAKDAAERAYNADSNGEKPRALLLYRKALEIIGEGLDLEAPSSGLGPKADNVAAWRHDLTSWREHVSDRIRVLESGSATSTTSAVPHPTAPRARTFSTSQSKPVTYTPHTSKPQPTMRSRPKAPAPAGAAAAASGRGVEDKYKEAVLLEVLEPVTDVRWSDVVGLDTAKQALHEAVVLPSLRADIFQGLRAPVRGLLLYGPPGNGKTLLARALASESGCTFFSISASSLTSKWVGEGEKLVRALFAAAAERQPAIIFIDEIDSILSARSANEHDAMRRLKTEFLVQFDGVAGGSDRVVVIGATNRPEELDPAVRRRLVKRIYIPLPSADTRLSILQHVLGSGGKGAAAKVSGRDLQQLAAVTEGYSASDLTALCKEAAMAPVRELGAKIASVPSDSIRPMVLKDLQAAMRVIRPSVSQEQLSALEDFTHNFGTT